MHDDYTRYIYVSTIQIKRQFFYFYACTCTFDYMNSSYHYAIRELLVCVKNMKCLLQCFTRDESGIYKLLSSCDKFRYLSSYTAIEAPERCVFGQLINIGAVLCKSTAY